MSQRASQLKHALTIDVEDYFHVSAFSDVISYSEWHSFESRVAANTRRLLEIFARRDVKATFFVLGWVAERHPRLVQEIQNAGHEIGCHSYAHQLIYQQSPNEFRDDLVRARKVLEDQAGRAVNLYRAPSFSITNQSLWACEILVDEGFEIDSSVYPTRHDRYGIPDADRCPHELVTRSGVLHEFPGTVATFPGGLRAPVGGGGYFRLLPYWLTHAILNRRTQREGTPFNFYLHPWEIDPDQPRIKGRWKSRFRHYQNLRTTEEKLNQLLSDFDFAPLSEVYRHFNSKNSYVVTANSPSPYKQLSKPDSMLATPSTPL